MIEHLIAGLLISAFVSVAGYRLHALSRGGVIAALFVGVALITGTSWAGGLMLGTFFVTSSVLSHMSARPTEAVKHGARDERQVLANGGIAALAALTTPWIGAPAAIALVGGALAAATSDTWATEIGSRSGRTPRMLLSRQPVPVGVSGGVTVPGTLASVAGAICIAIVAALATRFISGDMSPSPLVIGAAVALGGVAGSLVDTVLGETVQHKRYCDRCARETEAAVHVCGTETRSLRGLRSVDNDVVNLACTASGLIVAGLGYAVLA